MEAQNRGKLEMLTQLCEDQKVTKGFFVCICVKQIYFYLGWKYNFVKLVRTMINAQYLNLSR